MTNDRCNRRSRSADRLAAVLASVKTLAVVIVGGENGKGAGMTDTLMNLMLLKSTGVLPETSNPK